MSTNNYQPNTSRLMIPTDRIHDIFSFIFSIKLRDQVERSPRSDTEKEVG